MNGSWHATHSPRLELCLRPVESMVRHLNLRLFWPRKIATALPNCRWKGLSQGAASMGVSDAANAESKTAHKVAGMFLDSRSTATWPSLRFFTCVATADASLPQTLQEEVIPDLVSGTLIAGKVARSLHAVIWGSVRLQMKAQAASDAKLHPRIWAQG